MFNKCCLSLKSFTGDSKQSTSTRYVETQSMQIGASYMIQFNLVMGCGEQFTPHMDNQVKLEYSTNHGLTWHLVQEVRLCLCNKKNACHYWFIVYRVDEIS